jgi:hypothetical protein
VLSCFYSFAIGPSKDGAASEEGSTVAPDMGKTGEYLKVGQAARARRCQPFNAAQLGKPSDHSKLCELRVAIDSILART